MKSPHYNIFISYRRADGAELAQLVKTKLEDRGFRPFLDVESLGSGHFDEALLAKISAASDFVLLVTPQCLDGCKDKEHWVRREIAQALLTGRNVVPLLRENCLLPDRATLPPDIAELPRHNGVVWRHTESDACFARLIGKLTAKPGLPYRVRRRLLAGSLIACAILIVLVTAVNFNWLHRDTGAIHADTHAIKEDTADIKQDTGSIKQDTTELKQSIDTLAISIQQSIGASHLGPEYENTQFHREYQDKYIAGGGKPETLIIDYKARVASAPKNAMYHYLLARAYDLNKQGREAREEALAGYEVDPNYMWNRRALLYIYFDPELDLDRTLKLESVHYSITDEESRMFASDDPDQFIAAYQRLVSRFRKDPIFSDDLSSHYFCWHLFHACERWSLGNGRPFRSLIGKEAVSVRNTLRMKIKDVKVGLDAMRLLPNLNCVVVKYENGEERIGQSSLVRAVEKRKDIALTVDNWYSMSIANPPVAFRISVEPLNPLIAPNYALERKFSPYCQSGQSPQSVLDLTKLGPHDEKMLMPISLDAVDLADFSHCNDFWIYFGSLSVPYKPDGEASVLFEYVVPIGQGGVGVEVADNVRLYNDTAKNLKKAPTDAALSLQQFSRWMSMPLSELKGQRLQVPFEVKVRYNIEQECTVKLLGYSDRKIVLVYGPGGQSTDGSAAVAAGQALRLKWPSESVRETIATAEEDSVLYVTGTVVHNAGGTIYVIPDTATR